MISSYLPTITATTALVYLGWISSLTMTLHAAPSPIPFQDPFSETPIEQLPFYPKTSPLEIAKMLTPLPDIWSEIMKNSPQHQLLLDTSSSSSSSSNMGTPSGGNQNTSMSNGQSQQIPSGPSPADAISKFTSEELSKIISALVVFLDSKIQTGTDKFIDTMVAIFFHQDPPFGIKGIFKQMIHVLEHELIVKATDVFKNDIGREWERVKAERDRQKQNDNNNGTTIPSGGDSGNAAPGQLMGELVKQILIDLKSMVQDVCLKWVRSSIGNILDMIHDAIKNKLMTLGEKPTLPSSSAPSNKQSNQGISSVHVEAATTTQSSTDDASLLAMHLIHMQLNQTKKAFETIQPAQHVFDLVLSEQELQTGFEYSFNEKRSRRDMIKRGTPPFFMFKHMSHMLAVPVISTLLILSIIHHGLESILSREWQTILIQ